MQRRGGMDAIAHVALPEAAPAAARLWRVCNEDVQRTMVPRQNTSRFALNKSSLPQLIDCKNCNFFAPPIRLTRLERSLKPMTMTRVSPSERAVTLDGLRHWHSVLL
jgi:hypothetical protein